MRVTTIALGALAWCFGLALAQAEGALPNPVKTAADIRAYVDPDDTMTLATFKKLLDATGAPPDTQHGVALDSQCTMALYANSIGITQRVTPSVVVTARLVREGADCRLTIVTLHDE